MKKWLLLGPLLLAQCSPTPTLDEKRAAILNDVITQVDQDNLKQSVQDLVDAHDNDTPLDCSMLKPPFYPPYCHLTHDLAREWVRQKFQALGLDVYSHSVSDGVYSTETIIAEKKGQTHPNEIVFVGAHYDAFYSGADDNSTGVAAVLEIARVLSTRDFARTVRFIGFDLEEMGLVGSTRYATQMAANDDIVGAIVFDCIGYRSNEPNSQTSLPGFPSPSQGNFIAVIGNGNSTNLSNDAWLIQKRLGVVDVIGIDSPGMGESLAAGNLDRSDHTPFWLQGKPALFITDTANFRNANYHEPTDVAYTVDLAFVKGVTQLSAALIAYWAGG